MGRTQWHPVRHHESFRSGGGKAQRTLPNARRRCGRSSSANQPRTGDQSRPGRRRNMERKCDLRSLSFCVRRFLLFKPPKKTRERLIGSTLRRPCRAHRLQSTPVWGQLLRWHAVSALAEDGTLLRCSQKMARCLADKHGGSRSGEQSASCQFFPPALCFASPFCSIATAGTSQDF